MGDVIVAFGVSQLVPSERALSLENVRLREKAIALIIEIDALSRQIGRADRPELPYLKPVRRRLDAVRGQYQR
jgi:hypothetical protein